MAEVAKYEEVVRGKKWPQAEGLFGGGGGGLGVSGRGEGQE